MEAHPITESKPSPEVSVAARLRFYYLSAETISTLDRVVEDFMSSPGSFSLLNQLKRILPIEKWNDRSLRAYVEGMFYLSDRLWSIGIDTGKQVWGEEFSREKLVRITKTLPMSHYSYQYGSRNPAHILLTRDDALQDPAIAMIKLQHDIESLADFIRDSRMEHQV